MKSNHHNIPELLAPAGNLKSIRAAAAAGADAVYFGGKAFNARRNAANMTDEEMRHAVTWCKKHGIKVYVTLNILIKDQEFEALKDELDFMSTLGIDGLIVQDPGLILLLKKYYPQFKLQTSTQGSVYGLYGTRFFQDLGFERVVLPREMSVGEIQEIADQTDVELKIFCHGALCYAYSGQCLMSSMIGGRSGNRGLCAQPCRKVYKLYNDQGKMLKEGYLLSLKDLNTLPHIDEIIASGADSLKIEGRMKTPEYVYAVTKAYREALDGVPVEKREMDTYALNQVFNRDFTDGRLFGAKDIINPIMGKNRGVRIGSVLRQKGKQLSLQLDPAFHLEIEDGLSFGEQGSTGLRVENLQNQRGRSISCSQKGEIVTVTADSTLKKGTAVFKNYDKALMTRLSEAAGKEPAIISKPLSFEITIQKDRPVEIQIYDHSQRVGFLSDFIPQEAEKRSLTAEMVLEQFRKLGDTPYELDVCQINLDEGLFLSKGQLNNLRRSAIEAFEGEKQEGSMQKSTDFDLNQPITFREDVSKPMLSVQIQDEESLDRLLTTKVDKVILPVCSLSEPETLKSSVEKLHQAGKSAWLIFPKIMRTEASTRLLEYRQAFLELEADGIVVNSYEILALFKGCSIALEADQSMNLFNRFSAMAFSEWGFSGAVLSPELKGREVRELSEQMTLNSILPVYGHQEIMISANCPINCPVKHCENCKDTNWYHLEDHRGAVFPMRRDALGYTHIYNGDILCLHKELSAQRKLNEWRIYQTVEKDQRIGEIISFYDQLRSDRQSRLTFPVKPGEHYTKGNYKRGVE